jgi:arylsulfatase A-like enzyme
VCDGRLENPTIERWYDTACFRSVPTFNIDPNRTDRRGTSGPTYERPKEELYDLRNDPHEQRNLAADPKHAKRLAQMRAQLEAWMKSQNDSRKVFNTPRPLSDPASTKPAAPDEAQK